MAIPPFQDGRVLYLGFFSQALPIAVFFIVKSGKTIQKAIETLRAAIDAKPENTRGGSSQYPFLIAVIVSQYVLNSSLEGFGMAFLRTLFIRS